MDPSAGESYGAVGLAGSDSPHADVNFLSDGLTQATLLLERERGALWERARGAPVARAATQRTRALAGRAPGGPLRDPLPARLPRLTAPQPRSTCAR
jgi:hypothetical protein